MDKKTLGLIGEDTAARLLSCEGYRIIARNYRCKYGEIDIIASRDNCIYFVEVKTRKSYDYGRPAESVTKLKQEHIRKTAVFYLNEIKAQGLSIPRVRFHVIEVVLEHIENAF